MVFIKRIDAGLGEQARPRESHQSAQFLSLFFIIDVVDVVVGVLHEQRRELEEKYPHRVGVLGLGRRGGLWLWLGVDYFVDKNRDYIVRAVGVGLRRAADQLLLLVLFKSVLKTWYQDVLQDVGF